MTFIIIISTYLYLFGESQTLNIIKEEYLLILSLVSILSIFLYFKLKLKEYEIVEFLPTNNSSFKSIIAIFLFFEVIDYYNEGSFEGMVKLWFLYWIMGLIALTLMHTINYYKNYRLVYK